MTMRRTLLGGGTILLILACGSGEGPGVDAPTDLSAEAEAADAPTQAATGGWAATSQGVCQMLQDCGCSEYPDMGTCMSSLGGNLDMIGAGVHACIVGQSCEAMCNGGGVACVNSSAARASADSKRAHDINMEIIGNFPSGGACPNGQTQVVDGQGRFLRCQ